MQIYEFCICRVTIEVQGLLPVLLSSISIICMPFVMKKKENCQEKGH